jgi:DNA-binding transcriptional MerR regulator
MSLPDIPPKRYFAIGEVADLCGVKPHVLRYWEQEFPQLKPAKRRGNRRYYQPDDVQMIRRIRTLLYEQGFTIMGARAQLSVVKTAILPSVVAPVSAGVAADNKPRANRKQQLEQIRGELEDLLDGLDDLGLA